MKLKKLTDKGFAPHLLLVVVAVLVAVGGVGLFVYHKNKANAYYISEYGCHSTPTLSQGSSGACVTAVQYEINYRQCFPQMATDGQFGSITKQRVMQYQTKAGLTADGVVGPNTWGNILQGSPGRVVNCRTGK